MTFTKKLKLFSFITFFSMFGVLFASPAFAADPPPNNTNTNLGSGSGTGTGTTIDGIMCNAYGIFNGPLGKTFAVFAIVALGVGFFMGKVSWGTAIAIALGIGAIFGAPALVNIVTGSSGSKLCVKDQTNT